MANTNPNIVVSKTLLERAEALAREMKISRRRLVALALEDFIERHQNQRLLKQINLAYQDAPDPEEQKLLEIMRQRQRRLVEGEW